MRLIFSLQFCGDKFHGSQYQDNARSVQGVLEQALKIYYRDKIRITLASRLDAGVHARSLPGHFDLPDDARDLELDRRHINGILARDVSMTSLQQAAPAFHARRDAKARSYIYRLRPNNQHHPLDPACVHNYKYALSLSQLNALSALLPGLHDCRGLSLPYNYQTRPTCQISEAFWFQDEELFCFQITADHFLYRMVRIIVGTQLAICRCKIPEDALYMALETTERRYAGPAAPAQGLCLETVCY